MCKPAQHFNYSEVNHVGHKRQAASIAVSQQTEKQRSQRTRSQRSGYRSNNRSFNYIKVRGKEVVEKDDDEKVEGVGGPAKKAGGDGVSGAGRVTHGVAF